MNIQVLAGSLRTRSLSRAFARCARARAAVLRAEGQSGLELELLSFAELPIYDADLDVDGGPESVRAFKAAIERADGLLVITPEYNYSIPGGLKNALDWASRPAYKSVLAHKGVATVGLSGNAVGGARAVGHLKQVLLGTLAEPYPQPDFLLAQAPTLFNDEGELVDAGTNTRLDRMLLGFEAWLKRRALS